MTTSSPAAAPEARRAKRHVTGTQLAGLASIGAGLIHAAASGVHAEHPGLARLFIVAAAAQIALGLVTLVRGGRLATSMTAVVNAGAVALWAISRVSGISVIDGLEHAEAPQFIDTVCAALGALAAASAAWALLRRQTAATGRLGVPAVAVGALTVVAMMQGATHVHGHTADAATHTHHQSPSDAGHHHPDAAVDQSAAGGHDEASGDVLHGHDDQVAAPAWPRPWDPTAPIDFSGVPGVTAEQQARAESLVARTLDVLPQFADVSTLGTLGFHSMGDAATGYEHYINLSYLSDDAFLDPAKPETLSTRWMATNERSSRRCTSPTPHRSTTRSSSTTADR